eukprot:TRINITY_DN11746_c0_g1_i6.p1 TRINITY_DN11746_c0_g1~~TRINITY_DN11746_c0_g1_i6.p1  ORF type:complete len:514 (+),score=128.01 TRINITY_DN11746_c0_g1_i6:135-1676(+)
MLVFWIFLWYHTLAFIDIGIPRIKVEDQNFEADVKSTSVWSMSSLFGRAAASQISSYQLEGWSSCLVQNPHLGLKNLYTYNESTEILDFSIVNGQIYYLTKNSVKMLGISAPIKKSNQMGTVIKEVEGFSYLHVLTVDNDKLLIFLKSWNESLSYMTVEQNEVVSEIFTTESYFGEFTDTMQMKLYENFVMIPAGKNGLLVYKYDTGAMKLEYKGKLIETGDIRDFALTYSESRNSLVVLIADYEQGLIIMDVDKSTLGESKVEAVEVDKKEELINIKSVLLFDDDGKDKLLVIVDAMGGSSKYAILSLELGENIGLSFMQMRLIDGVASFGDYNRGFVSVIMPNSIMISKVTYEGDSMVAYLNYYSVNNAKITKMPNHVNPCLLYSYKSQLVATKIVANDGYLICQTDERTGTSKFSVLGQAKNCRVNMRTIDNCYYDKAISLHIVDKASLSKLLIVLIVLGTVMGVLLIGLVVILVIACRKYGVKYHELSEKRRLTLGPEEKKEGYDTNKI